MLSFYPISRNPTFGIPGLEDGLGRFSVSVPVFQLPTGQSPFFMLATAENNRIRISGSPMLGSSYRREAGIGGLRIDDDGATSSGRSNLFSLGGYVFLVDWTHKVAGRVSVNRSSIKLAQESISAAARIERSVAEFARTIYRRYGDSPLAKLAEALIPGKSVEEVSEIRKQWFYRSESTLPGGSTLFGRLSFPATDERLDGPSYYQGVRVQEILGVNISRAVDFEASDWISWRHFLVNSDEWSFVPDKLLLRLDGNSNSLLILPLWLSTLKATQGSNSTCEFPLGWEDLLVIDRRYWNKRHPLVQAFGIPTEVDRSELWNASNPYEPSTSEWFSWSINAILENYIDSEQVAGSMATFFSHATPSMLPTGRILSLSTGKNPTLMLTTADRIRLIRGRSAIMQYLPDPGPEWTLEVRKAERKRGRAK